MDNYLLRCLGHSMRYTELEREQDTPIEWFAHSWILNYIITHRHWTKLNKITNDTISVEWNKSCAPYFRYYPPWHSIVWILLIHLRFCGKWMSEKRIFREPLLRELQYNNNNKHSKIPRTCHSKVGIVRCRMIVIAFHIQCPFVSPKKNITIK